MNTILLEIQKTSINHSWMYYEFQVTTPRFVVETKLIPVPHHVNIGEPFPCEIKIKTSAWECEHDSVNALYILDIDTDCFTLCGKKRQLFKLQVGTKYIFKDNLILFKWIANSVFFI